MSSLHNDDNFYMNNFKEKKVDVLSYEIPKVKNFNDFNLSDFKAFLVKNGIHACDIKTHPSHLNDIGKISFKKKKSGIMRWT